MIKIAIVRGLKNINAYNEQVEAKREAAQKPRTTYFKIDDKQSVDIVFLQELDEDSPRYSEKNGLGFLAVEHTNPSDFRRKALCTQDSEGACYGCEQHRLDWKAGWKGKTRLYINVLVDDGINEPYVAVMSQSTSGQSITPTLIEYAGDDETITEKWFAVKRNGEKTDTSYTLRQKKEHGLNVEEYELFDLEQVVRQVEYSMQEAHYLDGLQTTEPQEAPSVGGRGNDTPAHVEW